MPTTTAPDYLTVLAECPVTYLRDLSLWGWDMTGPGWEAISPFGEIRAFYDSIEAVTWRNIQVRSVVEGWTSAECPIHGADCEAWA